MKEKVFFLKYLPVEGEIKEGDKIWLNNPHPKGQLRTAHRMVKEQQAWSEKDKAWTDIQDIFYLDKTPEEGSGFVYRNEVKLAKLFLCSRDIKVGDTIHVINHDGRVDNNTIVVVKKENGYCFSAVDEEQCVDSFLEEASFKVIGEVSPDSLSYVKEGDEFDEGDLSFMRVDRENGGGWKYTTLEDCKGFPTVIEIKGPCGHFH